MSLVETVFYNGDLDFIASRNHLGFLSYILRSLSKSQPNYVETPLFSKRSQCWTLQTPDQKADISVLGLKLNMLESRYGDSRKERTETPRVYLSGVTRCLGEFVLRSIKSHATTRPFSSHLARGPVDPLIG